MRYIRLFAALSTATAMVAAGVTPAAAAAPYQKLTAAQLKQVVVASNFATSDGIYQPPTVKPNVRGSYDCIDIVPSLMADRFAQDETGRTSLELIVAQMSSYKAALRAWKSVAKRGELADCPISTWVIKPTGLPKGTTEMRQQGFAAGQDPYYAVAVVGNAVIVAVVTNAPATRRTAQLRSVLVAGEAAYRKAARRK